MDSLIGVGVYTPAEAGRLLHISPAKISRWLRGHRIENKNYEPLWTPQITLHDRKMYLGFRDLMEARIANSFIQIGISPQRVRSAIQLAREVVGDDRPLSTDRFRTDGRTIFLQTADIDSNGEQKEAFLNLFSKQYEFRQVIEPLLKSIDFDDNGLPRQWWPLGKRGQIVVDPARGFGQPLDAATNVPTAVLSAAAKHHGITEAARMFEVPITSVRRAVSFEVGMVLQAAA
ncbi:hypothetical protein [Rhodopila sp.]|uniref:hypothetical protein n=1 Tax=Rhodopila sp. TaxID=2480087 RepID=UPI002B8A2059|nr:hypothetical protein [Rhodopila sp.]HVZ10378.1 hypothetical protein [Rhodopila sp.]